MISFISLIVNIILLDAFDQFRRIKYLNENIDHKRYGLRAITAFLIVSLVNYMCFGIQPLGSMLIACSLRWLIFDATLNILRGKAIDYLSTEENAAFTDQLLTKYGNQYIIKSSAFVGAVVINVLLTN